MENIAKLYAALSDPIRLRILALVAQEKELCVCELVDALQLSQPKISRHCKALNEAGILRSRRQAQWVVYSLADDVSSWVSQTREAAIFAVKQEPQHKVDSENLDKVQSPMVRDMV